MHANNIGEIMQIIVITDGKSNMGINPIEAAAKAAKKGIVVSAIGIIGKDGNGEERDIEEVEGIAKSGGGLAEYTHIENLGKTMQLMTQKTAQKTIEQIVSKQLKSIVGVDIQNLEPKSRFKIVDFIEKYGETINLKCVVVLDTSGSMKNKLDIAKKSLLELMENLRSRQGRSNIAVITFPGEAYSMCNVVYDFEDDNDMLKDKINVARAGGGTPTGPAIEMACELLLNTKKHDSREDVYCNKIGRVEEQYEKIENYYV